MMSGAVVLDDARMLHRQMSGVFLEVAHRGQTMCRYTLRRGSRAMSMRCASSDSVSSSALTGRLK